MLDKQLQTAGQEIIQNWLQKRYSHTHREANINDLRLLRRALDTERLNIFFYFYLLIFSFCAQIVNILTNKIHARKSVRKYAILADFCNILTVKALQNERKKAVVFSPETTEKTPEKH